MTYRGVYLSLETSAQHHGQCHRPSKPSSPLSSASRWLLSTLGREFCSEAPCPPPPRRSRPVPPAPSKRWAGDGRLPPAQGTARGRSGSGGTKPTPGWGEEGPERRLRLPGVPAEHGARGPASWAGNDDPGPCCGTRAPWPHRGAVAPRLGPTGQPLA